MLNSNAAEAAPQDDLPSTYSPDTKFVVQSFLATLANFDLDYQRERDLVSRSTKDPNLRLFLLQRLAKKHHERREPYLRHLHILQGHYAGEHGPTSL